MCMVHPASVPADADWPAECFYQFQIWFQVFSIQFSIRSHFCCNLSLFLSPWMLPDLLGISHLFQASCSFPGPSPDSSDRRFSPPHPPGFTLIQIELPTLTSLHCPLKEDTNLHYPCSPDLHPSANIPFVLPTPQASSCSASLNMPDF